MTLGNLLSVGCNIKFNVLSKWHYKEHGWKQMKKKMREASRSQWGNSFYCNLSFPWIYLTFENPTAPCDTSIENRGPQSSDCYSKQSLHNFTINQSQLNALPNCSPYLHVPRPAFEDIMQLLDSQPQHIFGRMSLSALGLILYLTGWCKVHLLLIKLLKLWSIQVCWHPLYAVVLCVNVLSHRLLLFHRLLLI